jgi:DNA-directed RNA polymerase subunit K/omega
VSQRNVTANKFEFVVVAGARARQLLRGCTPRTAGNEKLVKLAQKEVREGKVERIPLPIAD